MWFSKIYKQAVGFPEDVGVLSGYEHDMFTEHYNGYMSFLIRAEELLNHYATKATNYNDRSSGVADIKIKLNTATQYYEGSFNEVQSKLNDEDIKKHTDIMRITKTLKRKINTTIMDMLRTHRTSLRN